MSGYETSAYGIEWMRSEPEAPVPELVRTVPHVAFEGELRSMLGLKSGDVFSAKTIRQGLDQMHSAYASHQHPNFASVPDTNIHDSKGVIDLIIDCDEGKQVR